MCSRSIRNDTPLKCPVGTATGPKHTCKDGNETFVTRFGVPETITSDHGPQFTSSLWLQLCEMLSHKQTTAYHPESNSAVERLHRRLKDMLRARAAAATWS